MCCWGVQANRAEKRDAAGVLRAVRLLLMRLPSRLSRSAALRAAAALWALDVPEPRGARARRTADPINWPDARHRSARSFATFRPDASLGNVSFWIQDSALLQFYSTLSFKCNMLCTSYLCAVHVLQLQQRTCARRKVSSSRISTTGSSKSTSVQSQTPYSATSHLKYRQSAFCWLGWIHFSFFFVYGYARLEQWQIIVCSTLLAECFTEYC